MADERLVRERLRLLLAPAGLASCAPERSLDLRACVGIVLPGGPVDERYRRRGRPQRRGLVAVLLDALGQVCGDVPRVGGQRPDALSGRPVHEIIPLDPVVLHRIRGHLVAEDRGQVVQVGFRQFVDRFERDRPVLPRSRP